MKRTASPLSQLTLDELHQVKWLLGGILTLLGVWTVFYMDVEAWSLMIITSLVVAATLRWPTLPARVPRRVHTLAFPVMVTFFAGDLWLKSEVLPAMVRLDILLLLYRAISYRQRRDDFQVVVLGLFLIVVAGVLTVSLVFAAQILVYTGCALAFLLAITLTDAASQGGQKLALAPGESPSWAHVNWRHLLGRLWRATDWRVATLGGLLFVGVVGVSALLFLAIPRFQLENSMFLDRFISKKARTGFSDSISFGDVTEIQQDASVALSIDVSNQTEIPATPYWRMLVLDQYDNGKFRFSPRLRLGLGGMATAVPLTGTVSAGNGGPGYWTFYLESGVSRFLPLLGAFERLQFRDVQSFQFASKLVVLALREEPVSMTAYRVEGFAATTLLPDPAFARSWHERAQSRSMPGSFQIATVSSESDRAILQRCNREAAGEAPLPAPEFARRASEWLRRQHGYSLSPVIPGGEGDPLVRWLSSQESGHCELFAGALLLMARTAGYPARVVTGFKGGSWNGYSNNFTVRNSDAHAWTEIFDEVVGGWLRVDPLELSNSAAQADADRNAAALAQRTDRSWKARLDSLRVFWYRRIVSFDQRSQAETIKAVRDATQNTGKRLREALQKTLAAVRAWFTQPWDLSRMAGVLGVGMAIGLVATAGWLLGRGGWRRWQRRRGGATGDPVRREAGRWLRQLTELGVRDPTARPVLADLERLRFGRPTPWSEAEKIFRAARQALRAQRRVSRLTRT